MLALEQLKQIFAHRLRGERESERESEGDSANLWAMLTPIPYWLKTRFDLMSRRRNKQISHDQRNEQIQLKQWTDRNERQMIFRFLKLHGCCYEIVCVCLCLYCKSTSPYELW